MPLLPTVMTKSCEVKVRHSPTKQYQHSTGIWLPVVQPNSRVSTTINQQLQIIFVNLQFLNGHLPRSFEERTKVVRILVGLAFRNRF